MVDQRRSPRSSPRSESPRRGRRRSAGAHTRKGPAARPAGRITAILVTSTVVLTLISVGTPARSVEGTPAVSADRLSDVGAQGIAHPTHRAVAGEVLRPPASSPIGGPAVADYAGPLDRLGKPGSSDHGQADRDVRGVGSHPDRHSSRLLGRTQHLSQPGRTSQPVSTALSVSTGIRGNAASCVSQRQGIPASGAYFGGAVSGTMSLGTVERNAARTLPIHRIYFLANQVDYAIKSVQSDLAAGRLPWVSFKMPYSWADMAVGRGDAWAAGIADKLARVNGPVWLAFHHEPEGDGNIADWTRMQRHLAPIIHARTNNVAYTVILIGWNSFFGPHADQRIDRVYPGSQFVDIVGFDVYNEYGAKSFIKQSLDPMRYFTLIGAWARKHDVEWAIAETAFTKQAAKVDPNWLQNAFYDLKSEGGLALSYFNASQHSIADWTLSDPLRANAFNSLLGQSVRLC